MIFQTVKNINNVYKQAHTYAQAQAINHKANKRENL